MREQKASQTPQPTATPPKPDTDRVVITAEKFLAPLYENPTAPKPTESKAPEKEEDVWESIRGMRDSDKIIADLEAGGVMSFSELSGFFFNFQHDDDHTDELAPVYKEYKGKSGWSQSRFKKKNADKIEEYEETVKYIREHKQPYLVDGKLPTILDLMGKSNDLKAEWNRLNVEHTAFLTQRETAKKYTRQVRQYIKEQQRQRERDKYKQKKLNQRRKKDKHE